MRRILLTVAIMLASGTAMASSIEVIHGDRTGNDSVVAIACDVCAPVEVKPEAATPLFVPGTQTVSIRDVNGKRQIVRTEALLGGSPVTHVSSNPTWLPTEASGAATADIVAPGTDTDIKTSAVALRTPEPQAPSTEQAEAEFATIPLRPAF